MKKPALSLLIILAFASVSAIAQTSAFTYQGRLVEASVPANGQYDLAFRLYTPGGAQVGSDIAIENVQVSAGIFMVNLDFGASPFISNSARLLEISVRPGASTGAYTTLTPRQPITGSPFSIKAVNATSADLLSAACVLCVTDGHITSIAGAKVTGAVNYANFAGNIVGVVGIENGGTGSPTKNFVDLSTNQGRIEGNKEFMGEVSVVNDGVFAGNGSRLTNLNGANLTNGSVTASKLATDYRNGFDPQQVALLRWDQIPTVRRSFEVGRHPSALAFDGTFMYVANRLDNNVMRIRTSTGLLEGGPIPVGSAPSALAYDGTFMNVANSGSNSVTRIRASTGAVEGGPIGVGTDPRALAFDGTFLYVANYASNTVTRIRASAGSVEGSPIAVGSLPVSLVFDGAFIYVGHTTNPTTGVTGDVRRIRASTGAVEGTISNINAGALAFDGTFVYVANTGTIPRIRASTGVLERIPINTADGSGGTTGEAICFDGASLYVSGQFASTGKVQRVNVNGLGFDGGPVTAFGFIRALAFDGTYIYAASERTVSTPDGGTIVLNGVVIRF